MDGGVAHRSRIIPAGGAEEGKRTALTDKRLVFHLVSTAQFGFVKRGARVEMPRFRID